MKSRLLLHAVLIWAVITLAADTSFACSCGRTPPVLGAPEIKTPAIKIEAEHDVENVVLQLPFPKCKKKE